MFPTKQLFCNIVVGLALFLSACTLPTPTPTPAPSTLFVGTAGNNANDCLSATTACLTLHGAYTKSMPGSTINIGPGTFSETYGAPQMEHAVTLQGAGRDLTVINSLTYNVVVHVVGPVNVTIRGLTIGHGGGTTFQIGVDMVPGSSVTLQDCRLRNNNYAGVRNQGGRLSIQNCIIEGNHTGVENHGTLTITGSGVNNNNSGLANNSGSAQIDNSTFDGNGVFDPVSLGASTAVSNGEAAALRMSRVSVSHSHGFAIVLEGGTTELDGVAVLNNDGIGVWHQQGALTVRSSLLQNNGAYGLNVGGDTDVTDVGIVNVSQTAITGNHSAGLRIDGGEIHIQNTTISGNTATSAGGGGIWGYGGNLFLLDSTVAYNTGNGLQIGSGGPAGGSITIRRSVIALNSAAECNVDPGITLSSAGSPYVCSESWTPATLKLNPLVLEAGTYVHPIAADSPLVDAGGPLALCPAVDQRAYHRPGGATCDVGAYERDGTLVLIPAPIVITPASIRPTDTATLPPTPPPAAALVLILTQNTNCRSGPGTAYASVDAYPAGQSLQVDGQSEMAPLWWQVLMPNSRNHCWISSASGQPGGDPSLLPVVHVAPPPTATPKPGGIDFDKDGYPAGPDCNDKDAKIHPGAPETDKDGIDSNCNGDDDK